MQNSPLGSKRLACLLMLLALVLVPGLGSSSRLTYHEAFVAQGTREILDSANWAYPTISGLPWLEKPPLPWWLVAVLGRCTGTVNETIARLPSSFAAIGLVLGVAALATRHCGPGIGLLAGSIQATTAWTVTRGRLAEADILLACLVTWAIVAFDRIIVHETGQGTGPPSGVPVGRWRLWRWVFFILLGITGLVKGIGFGAALILSIVGALLLWRRDWVSLRRLCIPAGWALTAAITLLWPVLMVAQHGYGALTLWTIHVSHRLIPPRGPGLFAGEPWWEYGLSVFCQALPWTPLAVVGLWQSVALIWDRRRAIGRSKNGDLPAAGAATDQLLCVWAFIPLALVTLAPVKNAHYAISAQVPWSIWAALAMARLGRLMVLRGYDSQLLLWRTQTGFVMLALGYGVGIWFLGPYLDRHGREWAFYERVSRQIPAGMPLVLLYDDWDRNPYETPFGPIPHDLAVRLFYLGRPASWHRASEMVRTDTQVATKDSVLLSPLLTNQPWSTSPARPIAVIGRHRDLPMLRQLGQIEIIARGPSVRPDREYYLFRLAPRMASVSSVGRVPVRGTY